MLKRKKRNHSLTGKVKYDGANTLAVRIDDAYLHGELRYYITIDAPKAGAILGSPAALRGKDRPAILAFQRGKGRIVVIGDETRMYRQFLTTCDNEKLLLDIAAWLGHRE